MRRIIPQSLLDQLHTEQTPLEAEPIEDIPLLPQAPILRLCAETIASVPQAGKPRGRKPRPVEGPMAVEELSVVLRKPKPKALYLYPRHIRELGASIRRAEPSRPEVDLSAMVRGFVQRAPRKPWEADQ